MANNMNIQSFGNYTIHSNKSITDRKFIPDKRYFSEPQDKVDTSKTSPDDFMNNMKNLQELKKQHELKSLADSITTGEIQKDISSNSRWKEFVKSTVLETSLAPVPGPGGIVRSIKNTIPASWKDTVNSIVMTASLTPVPGCGALLYSISSLIKNKN